MPKYKTIILPIGGGGGITPTGTLNVLANGVIDVSEYEYVNVQIEYSVPQFNTITTSNITQDSVDVTYNIASDGGKPITSAFVCYCAVSAGRTPDPAYDTHIIGTTNIGSNNVTVTGLNPNTRYYVQAFAINAVGRGSSLAVDFYTEAIPATVPIVSITGKMDITSDSAKVAYNIDSDGGDTVTSRGVCYSTSQNPTINDSVVYGVTSNEWLTLSNLVPNTTYYVKAFAENGVGVGYSSEDSFTTAAAIEYLYIENTYSGQNIVNVAAFSAAGTTDAQYSKDGVNWTNMVFDSFPKNINITLNQGEKVYFRSSTGWSGDTNGIRIQPQQAAIAGGDLRTIINYTDVNSVTSVGRYDVNCLFKVGSGLTDISNVKLNTITSTSGVNAFEDFCWNCPNLVTGMDISSITSIYDNPNFDPDRGFHNMYYQCRSLTEAWAPNVTTWDADQFGDWLKNVSSSGVLHIPSGLCVGSGTGCIPENSVNGIPSGWTTQNY